MSLLKRHNFTSMNVKNTDRVILGIDPGTNIMGYAVVRVKGTKVEVMEFDVLNLKKLSSHALKLKTIFEKTDEIIQKFNPDEVALEAPFYAKNIQSMLKLGRAQGVSMAAALSRNLPVFEYSPRKIKQSITGRGSSTKEQVAAMLQRLLTLPDLPDLLDATDALAVAMCHYYQGNVRGGESKKYSSWKSFINENPGIVET